jgi:alkylation response protein AidB-like acyl-CoA dehydrogenase
MSSEAPTRPPRSDVAADIDVAERVSVLAPGFRERSALTESQSTVPRESIDELVAAGTARLLVPAEHGGLDATLRDLVEVTAAAAFGCPATGWLAAQMAHHPHIVGMFPEHAQDAAWAAGPDVVIASSTAPSGRAEKVPGGYRLTGRHPFASGINASTWVFVGAMVPAAAGPPEWRLFLVPAGDYTIDDVWHTAGMRGTGSNTVVISDLFVPAEHTLAQLDAREGTSVGGRLNANPKYRLPWMAFSSLGFTATMLGAVEGAYDHARQALAGKRAPNGARVAEGQIVQVDLAFAAARIAAARRTLLAIADRADAGLSYSLEDRATVGRDNTFAATLLVEAIDTLVALGGTGAFASTSPVQQAWRDVHFAAAHISVNKTDTGGRYGRIALGVDEKSTQGFF